MPQYGSDSQRAPASRWTILFYFTRPAAGAADTCALTPDYERGPSCYFRADSSCTSKPVICVGDAARYTCGTFWLRWDSLTLQAGDTYVRARHLGRISGDHS